jgi:peptide/nickel transport system substrate-binding protein
MKTGKIWVTLTVIMVISMVLASCGSSTTTASTTSTSATTQTNITTKSSTTTTQTSTAGTTTTITSTATATGNWWSIMGTPTYGGILTNRYTANIGSWDPYLGSAPQGGYGQYMETLWNNDYTVDPSIWPFEISFRPPQYADGYMLTDYELTSPTIVVAHIRQDIYWQNLPPANGRQFVASDVVFHYDRMLGLGDGFTTVDPYYASSTIWQALISVNNPDKFTVNWTFKTGTSPLLILTQLQLVVCDNWLECPEAVAAYTNASNPAMTNWHNGIGTGPYTVTDFVDGSSATYTANPSYWYYDKRWPQNRLPYISKIVFLIIPNNVTAEVALRTGKIDDMQVSAADASNIAKTNPEIVQRTIPSNTELTVDPRNDVAPFNNLNVRIAMQHAINIPLIASSYYGGTSTPWPSSLTQNQMGPGGWGDAYLNWPADVQAQYTYDPTLAKQMLATAGFPNGFNTDLILENDADQGLYQIVQSMFASVGINMSIQLMDVATWQSYVLNGRKYDALAARSQGLIGINSSPFSELSRFTTGYQLNYILFSDPKVDAWYAQAQSTTDVATVQQIMHDENLYLAQQHIVISISQPSTYNLIQPWDEGCVAGNYPLGQGPISGFWGSWGAGNWIDESIKVKY